MATSISQQLEDLLNPLPKFVDPEDDQDEDTKAKVIDGFDEGDDDDDESDVPVSRLRKSVSLLLSDTDSRYRGKATTRQQLRRETEVSEEESEEGEDEDIEDEEEEDEEDDDEADEASGTSDEDESQMKNSEIRLPKETDLCDFTEGMDDIGESEEGEEDDDDEEEDSSDTQDDEMEAGDAGGESSVMTFSKEKVDKEVEKGQAVRNQLALWDALLEGRIKLQKALVSANQLPQPQTFPRFRARGGAEFASALKNSHKALKALQRSLLELQDHLLCQGPVTAAVAGGPSVTDSEDEVEAAEMTSRPPKRKLDMSDYPHFMAKRFAAFQPYRDATLQKWHDKTRLSAVKTGKGFSAFDRNILTQVEQVLSDKERLLRRTQTRRSEYRVLGKAEPAAALVQNDGEGEESTLKANVHLKDLDEEIFDDDDFYHQLLRDLIERKTSASDPNDQVAMGRQWLAIQKLRSKIKKKVDTKASKGRKVRFQVHSKLVNFMAPIDHSSMNDDARTELYRSLFGKISAGDVTTRD